ncbi:chaplin [Glycomyces sp. TRM65418]|uniref:chaplin family protein n=1 Tax=Glycomyces sp. TRM65418 TaxID=2867006 RepID=UPI001CE6B480|nr:chaplin family protein [Glycomyces sp. TRM65418]MCC3764033.1 chaplin [Glycomyces sp. TRM65418]QZD53724.1 chaplin [Glycomyces sp. TRM65418]
MNYSWARKTAQTGFVAAGAVLVAGVGTAQAWGPDVTTQDQVGAVSGNQVVAPIQAPINICGIAAAVLGTADAACEGGASAEFNGAGDLTTQDNTGLGNGNQAYAPIQVPTEVSGIAAAVGGIANSWSTGGSNATVAESGRHAESDTTTQRNIGALSGNQLLAPIQAPVNACGNAIAVGGVSDAACEGGASAEYNGAGDLTTQDNIGLGNGNQLFAPIQAPINVCGNAIAILGSASASCEGGSDAEIPGDGGHHHSHKEHSTTESSGADVNEEMLPAVPGLDTVSGATGALPVDGVPVVGGLVGNTTSEGVADTATDTLAGVTELAGAGLL